MPLIGQDAKGQTVLFDMLDWHNPLVGSYTSTSRDEFANSNALISSRDDESLPDPPEQLPLASSKEDPTATSLDLQVFMALMEIARHASVRTMVASEPPDVVSLEMELTFHGSTFPVTRPSNDDLPKEARHVRRRMKEDAKARIDQMLAQNVEPDRHMLEAVGLFPTKYPHMHAFARLLLLTANIFCIPLKDGFRVPRPSQVTDGGKPMLNRPPWLPMPGHSAFPAGHAMQCMLVAHWMDALLKADGKKKSLTFLAQRVADNRVVAGLHYDADNQAGFDIATWIAGQLVILLLSGEAPAFKRLLFLALAEGGFKTTAEEFASSLLSNLGAQEPDKP